MDPLSLGDLVGQGDQCGHLLEQCCPGALIAPPSRRQLADLSPLLGGYSVELVFARLAAGQDPEGMELAPSAAAGGLAAFSFEQVEGARGQRALGGHDAQKPSQGAVLAPEPLTKGGEFCRHLYYYNII